MRRAPSRSTDPLHVGAVVRVVVTLAVLAAVWWPARPGASDGFPLSNYPMFARPRSGPSIVRTVLGVQADGRRRPLTPQLVGGTRNAKHALATVLVAVERGQPDALCTEVAQRVATSPRPEAVVALEVVTDTWDAVASLEAGAVPMTRTLHARCEVP